MQRVQKLLSNRGHCARRAAEELIAAGRVTVDGRVITLGESAPDDAAIAVDGKPVARPEKVYLAFHKPAGVVTAVSDRHERTIFSLIDLPERLIPVGRLDKETEGLILLTNDGDWANSIAHPSHEVVKTYVAELDQPIRDSEIKRLTKGLALEDGVATATRALRLDQRTVELDIHIGRNRVVRRMFAALGYDVIRLKRTRVGRIVLGNMKRGTWRRLAGNPPEI